MDMELLIFIVLLILIFSLLWSHKQTKSQIETINSHLIENKTLQAVTTNTFGQIQSSIGRLTETSRHMEELGKEITSLNDILHSPKLRGGIGELLLGDLLSQILSPDNFQLQYTFKNGERVDAVVILKAGMVPIDSKFPLESFQRIISTKEETDKVKNKKEFYRALRTHIKNISQKYIRPDEGTFAADTEQLVWIKILPSGRAIKKYIDLE